MGCDQAVLPNQPRGIPRLDDRRVHNGMFYWAVDRTEKLRAMRRREGAPGHLCVDDGALAAILVRAGVAAILTSISLTGFSVQAWVT